MIRLSFENEDERERIQAEYLIRLIRSQAINFGCKELLSYIASRFPSVRVPEITLPVTDVPAAECTETDNNSHNNERFFLVNKPALYHFLFPNGELDVKHLVWLLLGVPPEDNPFSAIRNSLEAIINISEKTDHSPLDENKKKNISNYSIRFDRLRAVVKDDDGWDTAYWLQQQLKVRTCPYCNANYTRVSLQGRFRADLEHFFPKSKYPYLAITFYNLFPACQTCNKAKGNRANIVSNRTTNGKGTKACEILFPWDEGFDSIPQHRIPFRVVMNEKANPLEVLCGISDQFKIQLIPMESTDTASVQAAISCSAANDRKKSKSKESKYWERALNTIRELRLEQLYEFHKPEIQKLLRNHYIFNRLGIYDRARLIPLVPGTTKEKQQLNQAAVEILIRDMLFFADTGLEQLGNAPLNKLKADILEQLEMPKAPRETHDVKDVNNNEYTSANTTKSYYSECGRDPDTSLRASEQCPCPV